METLTIAAPPDDRGPAGDYMMFAVVRTNPTTVIPSSSQFVRLF
jgi:hypothetical protein